METTLDNLIGCQRRRSIACWLSEIRSEKMAHLPAPTDEEVAVLEKFGFKPDTAYVEVSTIHEVELSDDEYEANDHIVKAANIIMGWGLKANQSELFHGIHVMQQFIVQRMLSRLNPGAWNGWYENPNSDKWAK